MISAEGYRLALGVTQAADTSAADAVAALVPVHGSLLFRVAHTALRNRAEAEDVVQETFLRALQHHRKLPEIREMRVWLVRIAWNLALDRRRRIRPDQMDAVFAEAIASATVPADRALGEAARLRLVLHEMERLPASERHSLLLSALEEMGTAEIAAVMEKSESAVRALLFRARTHLRERVDRAERRKK